MITVGMGWRSGLCIFWILSFHLIVQAEGNFYFFKHPKTWHEAQDECTQNCSGNLVSWSQDVEILVMRHLPNVDTFWIGNYSEFDQSSSIVYSCSFESDFCGWEQIPNVNFRWARNKGTTNPWYTGPSGDKTTGDGYYIYIDSSENSEDEVAKLISPVVKVRSSYNYCLKFWYHMYGSNIGQLSVYIFGMSGQIQRYWSKHGDQENVWHEQYVDILQKESFFIIIEATGNGYYGDIALDDLLLTSSSCTEDYKCNFDTGFCDWYNTEVLKWERDDSGTGTEDTGPSFDASGGGYFAYVDASGVSRNQSAKLVSPLFNKVMDSASFCLRFHYHMFGNGIGHLFAAVGTRNGETITRIWSQAGKQGDKWISSEADFNSSIDFKIVFEAVRGKNRRGDIALDDISIEKNTCSSDTERKKCPFINQTKNITIMYDMCNNRNAYICETVESNTCTGFKIEQSISTETVTQSTSTISGSESENLRRNGSSNSVTTSSVQAGLIAVVGIVSIVCMLLLLLVMILLIKMHRLGEPLLFCFDSKKKATNDRVTSRGVPNMTYEYANNSDVSTTASEHRERKNNTSNRDYEMGFVESKYDMPQLKRNENLGHQQNIEKSEDNYTYTDILDGEYDHVGNAGRTRDKNGKKNDKMYDHVTGTGNTDLSNYTTSQLQGLQKNNIGNGETDSGYFVLEKSESGDTSDTYDHAKFK